MERTYFNQTRSSQLHKVCRKGDKIYHVDSEHITDLSKTAKTTTKKVPRKPSDEPSETVCKVISFEPADDDIDKCVAFWKSIVERNLEPVKCVIIESLNQKDADSLRHEPISKPKTKTKKNSKPKKRTVDSSKGYWVGILEELQKKRLDEVKLLARHGCKFCEALSTDVTDDSIKSKKEEIEEDLKDLESWVPAPENPRSKFAKQSYWKTDQGDDTVKKESDGIDASESKVKDVKLKSEKYEFIDVINQKKSIGGYSKWRKPEFHEMCACEHTNCYCKNHDTS